MKPYRRTWRGHGWELAMEEDAAFPALGRLLSGRGIRQRWALTLAVQPWQAAAIASQPGRGQPWFLGLSGQQAVMGDIAVTATEAVAIVDGARPLDVLLPPLRVRSLDEREMMSA